MAFNFGDWVVRVAINGVMAGAFTREWAALQLADYFVRGKITETDLSAFDEAIEAFYTEQTEQTEVITITDSE